MWRLTIDKVRKLDDLHACRPLDQLDFIAVGSIDEDEPAAGGSLRGAVSDLDTLGIKEGDRLVEAFNLEGQMNKIFLDLDRPTWRKTGQFDQFVAVGYFQEGQVRSAGRGLSFDDLKTKDGCVKPDGLVQITDPHAGVEQLLDSQTTHSSIVNGHWTANVLSSYQ